MAVDDTVQHPRGVLGAGDEAGVLKELQVPRNCGLRLADDGDQLALTYITMPKGLKYLEPVRVPYDLEYPGLEGLNHQ